jgi:ankyrin repeat protein
VTNVKFPSAPEPALHRAARLGDIAELERLAGADLEARWDHLQGYGLFFEGLTPLHLAAGSLDGATAGTVRRLLEKGADLHARSSGGVTAAWYAAGAGLTREPAGPKKPADLCARLRLLLDAGLDPHETASNGRSLLVEACRAGDPDRVRLLLERGAAASPLLGSGEATASAPSSRHSSFQIPLFCAAESGSPECVRLVLEAGADPDTRDDRGATALFHAASPEAARALLDAGADLQAQDDGGRDAVDEHLAESAYPPERRRIAVARAIIAAGAKIERRDEWGHTRLHSSAFGRAADAVEALLELGADPLAEQGGGQTPLHAVAWQGESTAEPEWNDAAGRIIDLLVAAGVDPRKADADGSTPLHEAAGGDWGSATAIRALLRHGAEIDAVDGQGNTPLVNAASRGEVECVRALLEAGADPERALETAREHLEIWREIVAEAGEKNDIPYVSPEQRRETETKALADAEASLALIERAAGRARR